MLKETIQVHYICLDNMGKMHQNIKGGFCLLLLLSHFSRVWLCATPETAAHQAPPSLGFSRQEHWSGLPFPSPMYESDKWKQSRSVIPDSLRSHGLQPTRLLCPWDFPARVLEWGAIAFSRFLTRCNNFVWFYYLFQYFYNNL